MIFQSSINLVLGDRNQCYVQDRVHGLLSCIFWHTEGQLVLGRALQHSKESIRPSKELRSQDNQVDYNERNFITYFYSVHLQEKHLISRHENNLYTVKFLPSVSEILQLRHKSPFWRGKVTFSSVWWEFGILLPWTIWKISTWDSLRYKSNSTQMFPMMETLEIPAWTVSRWSRRTITIISQWCGYKS